MEVGALGVNCYVVYDEKSRDAAVIDAGDEAARIIGCIEKNNLTVKYLINTHAHADHIGANTAVKEKTGARLLVHEKDAPQLDNPKLNLSAFMGAPVVSCQADEFIKEGDAIKFGDIELKVIETPGHTPGSVCLLTDGVLFSGDTLFQYSVGRCDLPGGSMDKMMESLRKLKKLPPDTTVYTGHGAATSIGTELEENPYMNMT
jgi:glyoxylase-like metal-dependent hydrolase (beta-lactamase superfamily II)